MNSIIKISVGCFLLVLHLVTEGTCRAVEQPLGERLAQSQVIGQVQVTEILATNPPGHLLHTAKAEVLLPIKGVAQGQIITFDYDTGLKCPNVVYSKGEDCLVFLNRQRNGRLTTLNHYYGKYVMDGNMVRGWSVKRYSHRDVPFPQVVQMIRKSLTR